MRNSQNLSLSDSHTTIHFILNNKQNMGLFRMNHILEPKENINDKEFETRHSPST